MHRFALSFVKTSARPWLSLGKARKPSPWSPALATSLLRPVGTPRLYSTNTIAHELSHQVNRAIETHDYHKALSVLAEMHERGVKPEHVTYGRILRMYSDLGYARDAERTLEEMRRQGKKPSVVMYNAVLHMYAQQNDVGAARRIFEEISRAGIVRDERTFVEMIRLACVNQSPEDCKKYLHEMLQDGLTPTLHVYTDIIFCLAKKHWYKDAMDLYERMKHRGLKPDAVILNLMLEIGTLTKDYKYVRTIVEEMWGANVEPHPEHYEAIRSLEKV
eukprot:TRINITY_DN25222_c0_g1_i1.p1 TRINITY_DN25222_c0_g1~~TRINITY_DN25222_c0_g1_i1.p1  ORF type:complete len:275 (+),score=42.45 TRINITY_DN25222_c0_g1_i1:50-874(+)